MAKDERGTYVVGIPDVSVDVESLKALISGIRGVSGVEANYLTHKLKIDYDGKIETLERVKQSLAGPARPRR